MFLYYLFFMYSEQTFLHLLHLCSQLSKTTNTHTLKQLITVNIGVSSCPLSLLAVNQACWSALTARFTEGLTK